MTIKNKNTQTKQNLIFNLILEEKRTFKLNDENKRVNFSIDIIDNMRVEPFEFFTVQYDVSSKSGFHYVAKNYTVVYIEDNDCMFF